MRFKNQCGTIVDDGPNEGLTERSLQDAQRLFLMNDVVQPVSVDPLVWQDDVRFSRLVVDIVQGQDTLHHVMYIGTGALATILGNPMQASVRPTNAAYECVIHLL